MLLPAEALIVVAFALKQLLKVGFAVKFPVQCCIAAQAAKQNNCGQVRSGLAGKGRVRARAHLSLV